MLKKLRRYVLLLVRLHGAEHIGDGASYAEEMVQGTITDVLAGVLRWDSAKDLESYLTDVIRLRVRRDCKRTARYREMFGDDVRVDSGTPSIDELETHVAGAAFAEAGDRESSSSESMNSTMQRMRELVYDDPLAGRFLDAVEQDAATRTEIMRAARLTRAEFHNTRRRLARLLAQLRPNRNTESN